MNTKYTIKNFRVFDSDGATFELNPITILTGCNSSGKSSLVKSLMLLGDYFRRVRDDYNNGRPCHLQNYKLDFSKAELDLGNFKKALNFKAKKDSKITFSYIVGSLLLGEDLTVELSFKADKVDELNNGWLSDISISKSDGLVLYAAEVNNENELEIQTLNLDCIKDAFIDFSSIASCYSARKELRMDEHTIGGREIDDLPLKKQIDEMDDIIKNVDDKLFKQWSFELNFNKDEKYISIVDYKSLGLMINLNKNRNILYMPVFDWIKGLSKKDVRTKVNAIMIDNNITYKEMFTSLSEIFDDYEKSKYDNFMDFFLSFEKETFARFDEPAKGENFIEEFINKTIIEEIIDDDSPEPPFEYPGLYRSDNEHLKKMSDTKLFFYKMYTTLMSLSLYVDKNFKKMVVTYLGIINSKIAHPQYEIFQKFFAAILEESLIKVTKDFSEAKYVGTTIAHVQRIYTYDQNNSFSNLLKQYFESLRSYNQKRNLEFFPFGISVDSKTGNTIFKKWSELTPKEYEKAIEHSSLPPTRMYNYEANTFINHWIREFNIGHNIEIATIENGSGISVYLYKNGDKYLLPEEGYGITQLLSFLIQIEVAILDAPRFANGPLYCGSITIFYGPTTVSIEEPENHLHPAFQSKLADMLLDAYQNYNISFIVETHSEYLIRKLQTLVAKKQFSSKDISLYYLYDPDESKRPNHVPQLKKIEIQEDGCLSEPFGSGFFDEADNLSMELLTIKANPTWQN